MRHRARMHALQALYQADIWGHTSPQQAAKLLHELQLPEEVESFALEMIAGTLKQRAEIDERLRNNLEKWRLERLSVTTRNILRLATYELCYGPDLPRHVVFDEALELCKEFVDESFHGLVNRVLQKVYDAHQGRNTPEDVPAVPPSPEPPSPLPEAGE